MAGTPEEAAVRAELQRLLASPAFAHAEKLSSFLRYVVEETLAGRAKQLKETVIGIDVYGRPPSYDPRIDSIVRGEANKLRARLEAYYQRNGREGDVVLSVPKGGYAAQFAFAPRGQAPGQGRRATPPVTLIGRDREREQLEELLEAARAGQGSFALIGGEPGIGKTHLTRALVAEAIGRGYFAVLGHCYEMEGAPPYVPFIEMLEYSARVLPREAFRESLGDAAAEVARLMPELRRIYPDIGPPLELPPERQRRYLFNAYREFVERAVRAAPIVAVFEDLHWADEATLLLMAHLAQTVATMPVLMIGTYRDVELGASRPFARTLEGWIRERTAGRLMLRRFDSSGVEAMLAALSGQPPPPAMVSTVFEETDGNPFFVEEVFRFLDEEGRLLDEQGAWRAGVQPEDLRVPPSLRLVIGRRLERLAEETRRVLAHAAVAGRSFDLELLEDLEAGQRDTDSPVRDGGQTSPVLDAIDEAEAAWLVAAERSPRQTRYRFVHELVRQTLAETLPTTRRQRLHARIADAIERLHRGDRERQASALAHHLWHAGAAADADKTVDYLMLAAKLASEGAAHEDALTHTDRALSIAGPGHGLTPELHRLRATALRSLGRADEASAAYERAAAGFTEAGDFAAAAEASFHLALMLLWRGDSRGLDLIDRAAQLIAAPSSPLLLRLLFMKAMALGVLGRMEESLAALDQARRVEPGVPGSDVDGFSRMCEARIRYATARLDLAGACGREAQRRFRRAGNLWGEAEVFESVSEALWRLDSPDAEPLLRRQIVLAERVGNQNALWAYRIMETELAMMLGDLEAAERAAQVFHRMPSSVSAGWRHLDYVVLAAVAHYRGKLDEAIAWSRRGLEIEYPTYLAGQLSGSLFWSLAARQDAQAGEALRAARVYLPVAGRPLTLGAGGCLAFLLEGLAWSGRREEAAALEAHAERVVAEGPDCMYAQNLFRTAAGIAAAAARHWSRAAEHHQAALRIADGKPYRVAQPVARTWYSEMLLARGGPGDRQRARDLRAEALHLYESLGMLWHARRAAERLAAP